MGFYVDLDKIQLNQYRSKLESADLLPSRVVLKEGIRQHFKQLEALGIRTVGELLKALGSKKKLEAVSEQSGIDLNYLTILAREIKSYKQKPSALKDFPGVPEQVAAALEGIGIKNTLQLYDQVLTPEQRKQLADRVKLEEGAITRLAKLTDLSRVRWVNHTFAHALHEAGYDTAQQVARADYATLYEDVKRVNKEKGLYKGQVGLHDMKLCVEAARELEHEIEM